jgi:RNA polymerase sigma-70 factor (ECF subfamily)
VGTDYKHDMDKKEIDRAFTELYEAHLKDVYSFLYYRLGNHHDAEDVSEQVFLQAYRHLPKALNESEGRSLRPWLIRIAQNLAINLYRDRSRKPQSPLDAAGEFADDHDTENLVEAREELERVFEQVSELSDDRREALIMRFALGMDNGEIARAMGKTEGATKVLLHRAIKQLEQALAEDELAETTS